MTAESDRGAATGAVRIVLRLEGLAIFAVAAALYVWHGGPWWLFLILFLAPDLSFLGYLVNARVGGVAYDAVHSTLGPLALGAIGIASDNSLVQSIALIWAAHVGFDRALGYGLKYATGFGDTHLGRIGRK